MGVVGDTGDAGAVGGTEKKGRGPGRPFQKGNTAAARHGAKSRALVAQRAPLERTVIVEAAPWMAHPEFALALQGVSEAAVGFRSVSQYLRGSFITRKGTPKPGVELFLKLSKDLRSWLSVCGMTPSGEAAVKESLAAAHRDRLVAERQKDISARYGEVEE